MSTEAPNTVFSSVEEAIEEIRAGRFVVVVDDEDRENEGDLTIAAQFVTPEAVNFMATHGRGLICLCLTPERCEELGLRQMTDQNETPFGTAFTVSIEAREGVSTGISAHDRAHTIQVAIDPTSTAHDLVQPGHVFPLRARTGGVLQRSGQTEAAVDLARLAGLVARRRRLRDHERGRHDGPGLGPRRLLRAPRAEDGHRRRPDRVPAPAREARRARRLRAAPHGRTASSRRSPTRRC